jgi:PhnB protein
MPKAIPEGYHSVTPYLAVHDGAGAIEFYKKAFKAEERMRFEHEGRIGHAELQIGDSVVMLSDEYAEMGVKSPKSFGGSPISLHLYVQDVDSFVDHAVKTGAKLQRAIENKFYGDRSGTIEDPYGHTWHISTHVEDLSPEEMEKRAASAPGA